MYDELLHSLAHTHTHSREILGQSKQKSGKKIICEQINCTYGTLNCLLSTAATKATTTLTHDTTYWPDFLARKCDAMMHTYLLFGFVFLLWMVMISINSFSLAISAFFFCIFCSAATLRQQSFLCYTSCMSICMCVCVFANCLMMSARGVRKTPHNDDFERMKTKKCKSNILYFCCCFRSNTRIG